MGLRDLWALLISFHIYYHATTFEHQYFFEWHILFEPDTLALSACLWNAQLLYPIFLFLWGHCLSIRSLFAELMFFPELRQFCNTFWTKLVNNNLHQTWGPTSPEILRYYVVKASYVPKIIRTELKNNQAKKEHYDLSLVIIDRLTMSNADKH